MRPYLLKGHERPLTQLKCDCTCYYLFQCALVCANLYAQTVCMPMHKHISRWYVCSCRYNREGDLLFSCAKVSVIVIYIP